MATKRQRLAPKGLGEAESAAAILSHGYGHTEEPAPEPEPAPPPAAAAAPAKPAPTSAPQSGRSDAEGMTRRTYYLQAADADALEAAVTRIHKTMRGLVPKHRILGAIIAGGLDNLEFITQRLKDELLAGLD